MTCEFRGHHFQNDILQLDKSECKGKTSLDITGNRNGRHPESRCMSTSRTIPAGKSANSLENSPIGFDFFFSRLLRYLNKIKFERT